MRVKDCYGARDAKVDGEAMGYQEKVEKVAEDLKRLWNFGKLL